MDNENLIIKNSLIKILDININLLDTEFICNKIIKVLKSATIQTLCISTVNIELIMLAQKNPIFKSYLNEICQINTIDGVGILNVLRWYGLKNYERVCGSDLAYELAYICQTLQKKYFILGAAKDISEKAKNKLKELYPNLNIDNYSPPFTKDVIFSLKENINIKKHIETFKPDVLCVAFGAPKQELWIKDNLSFLSENNIKIVIGLGGSFDFIAGKVKRAPLIFKNTGNEWLFRLLQEPKSRFKRQITTIPQYYYLCAKEFIRKKFQ